MTMSLRLASHLKLIYFHVYYFVITAAVRILCTAVLATVVAFYIGLYTGNAEQIHTVSSTNSRNYIHRTQSFLRS